MNLKKIAIRALSGLVYCLIIIGCIISGYKGVTILASLLTIWGCLEFTHITGGLTRRNIPAAILDIAACLSLSISLCIGLPLENILTNWLAIIMLRLIVEIYLKSDHPLRHTAHSLMSQIYIGVPMAVMVYIAMNYSPYILLTIFVLMWLNDTGAYLVGCSIGRHKLIERVSPKKTWEGFFGGLIFSMAVSLLIFYFIKPFEGMEHIDMSLIFWLSVGAIVSIIGTWGDLIESMIKRDLQIKDSGNLIPGHGGILDRIDSILFVLPAILLFLHFWQ
ncbi:MAG: phosphatidate cytidylyltransferase [Muribaculaceae bacterium]|nr:phosphatidate cytidylyltransferase [Bacteroidales bacterium]MDY2732911.1 phosphatidate cytidylyltransferase [Muribaculaceae bacterium]MDY4650429.1 phosphatidate cytidylyltransferase [Muribaculaceae bacterium]MDY5388638.1 phosphatidate cytidylyltransferase [Muribaculaceae bacterium]